MTCNHLYINLACLGFCLFVSNKRQNDGTDGAQSFVWLHVTQGRFMNDQN